jgi:hypothetical protein
MANHDRQLSISDHLHSLDVSNPPSSHMQLLSSLNDYQQPFNQLNLQVLASKDVLSNSSAQINQQVDIQIGFLQDQFKKLKA